MTDRLERIINRTADQFNESAEFFLSHLDFSLCNKAELIEALNHLISKIYPKLVAKTILRSTQPNYSTVEEGYRPFKLTFLLNGDPIQELIEGDSVPNGILFVDKKIPRSAPGAARDFFEYYRVLDEFYRQVCRPDLPYLVDTPTKILINVSSQPLQNKLQNGLVYHSRGLTSENPTHFRYERFPLVVFNSNELVKSVQTEAALVVNIIEWNDKLDFRHPVKAFTKNQITNFIESAFGLLVITANASVNIDLKQADKLNHDFFHTSSHRESLNNTSFSVFHRTADLKSMPRVIWIDDLQVGLLYDELLDLMPASVPTEQIEWVLTRLLNHGAFEACLPFLAEEILFAKEKVYPNWEGLLNIKIPAESHPEIKSKVAQLQKRILTAMRNRSLFPNQYHQIILSESLLQNDAFKKTIPESEQRKLTTWKNVRDNSGKTLILDFPAHKPIKTNFLHFAVRLSHYDFPLINRGYRALVHQIQLRAIRDELKSLSREKFIRLNPPLDFEIARRKQLLEQLAGLPDTGSPLLDLYQDITSQKNNPDRYRLDFGGLSEVSPETQKYLVKLTTENWNVLPLPEVFRYYEKAKVESIFARQDIDSLLKPKESILPFDWRAALIKKAKQIGLDKAHQILTEMCHSYQVDMVSKEWFESDWLNPGLNASSPSRKLRLLIIGEFAGIPRSELNRIHGQKIAEQVAHTHRNRNLLKIICRYQNLNLDKNHDHQRLAAKYMSDSKFAKDLEILKEIFQYTPQEWTDTELMADIYQLLFACQTRLVKRQLTSIIQL